MKQENTTIKTFKDLYLNKFWSLEDIALAYPALNKLEVTFLLQENGVKIRMKKDASLARKKKIFLEAEEIKPSKSEFEALLKRYGSVVGLWANYFRQRGVTIKILQIWAEEYGLQKEKRSKLLSPEERMNKILNKLKNA